MSADEIQPTRPPDGLAGLGGVPGGLVAVGDVIDGYRIERVAGSGGMGVVYQAEETGLGRRVALKVIAPERSLDPNSRALFAKEATAAAAVEHPNVLPVYRAGETSSGQPYIAMRYVNGPSLKQLLAAGGALAPGRAAHISSEIGRALAASHASGLLHRDVKPGNILVTGAQGRDHAYLADFGISAATAPPGSTVGTAGYLAPEILAGGPPTAAADVYALGCVLLECLLGHSPSPPIDVATAISEGAPSTPNALKDAILAALLGDPSKRPSATQFADAVASSRHDLVIIHHSSDTAVADDVLESLREEGMDVAVSSGDGSGALHASAACAILVGESGLGRWARLALLAADDVAKRDPGFGRLAVSLPGSPALHDRALDAVAGWPGLRLHSAQSREEVVREIVRAYRTRASQAVVGDREVCPYPGLDSFDEATAGFFVGREEETAELVDDLRTGRFVTVLGPSGYGKSSLLLAGLIPALRRGGLAGIDAWQIAKVTPGDRPAARIAEALSNLDGIGPLSAEELLRSVGSIDQAVGTGSSGTAERVLLVCDQFEEIFTLCDDGAEREGVIDALVHAATIPAGRFVLVLAMRADFYPRLADHQRLRSLVAAHQLLVGPLTGDALRRAIEVPAAAAGLDLEPGLAQTVAEDVGGRPGALPLMSHVLSEVWQRRQGRELTLAAYAACGGVEGALARMAEEVYASIEPDDRSLTRRVLLRLVTPGEGTEDTRNRVPVRELASGGAGPQDVERVLQVLTRVRIVTVSGDETGEPTVELTHEALLRGWPRLRAWIDESRDALRLARQLAVDAAEWTRARDDGALLRGARLAVWTDRAPDELNESEQAFLTASRDRADGDARARRRRTQLAVSGLSGGLFAVGGLAVFAFVQRNDATGARDAALSRQLAGSAREQLQSDPELSLLLSTRAEKVADTAEAEASLRQAVFQSSVRIRHKTAGAGAKSVAVSRDNRMVATTDDTGRIDVWNPTTGAPVRRLKGHTKAAAIVSQPDGAWLSASQDGTIRRWPSGSSTGRVLYRGKPLTAIASTPDGTAFAAGDETGVVRLFLDGTARPRIVRKVGDSIRSIAIDPRALTVAAGTGGKLTLIPTSGAPSLVALRTQSDEGVSGLDFSPDGGRLAIATTSGSVLIRSLRGGAVVHLRGHTNKVNSARFSRDGRRVTTSGAFDNSIRIWSAQGGAALSVLNGHEGTANDAAFDGADHVVSGADDGTARVWAWTTGRPQTYAIPGKVGISSGGIGISPDGTTAMTVLADGSVMGIDTSTGATRRLTDPQPQPVALSEISHDGEFATFARDDGTIVQTRLVRGAPILRQFDGAKGRYVYGVRRSADGEQLAVLTDAGDILIHTFSDRVTTKLKTIPGSNDLDMTADGSTLATASAAGITRVWSAGSSSPTLELPTSGAEDYAVALSPDAPLVASGGAGRTVTIWNRESGQQVARLVGHAGVVYGIEFSPDGSRLMTLGNDGAIIWDTTTWRLILRLSLPQAFAGAFGPDGRLVTASLSAASSSDYAVKTWLCEVCGTIDTTRRLAARRTTRELTTSEADRFLAGLRP